MGTAQRQQTKMIIFALVLLSLWPVGVPTANLHETNKRL